VTALAYYAGMRVGDVGTVQWTAWDGEVFAWRQSKTGYLVHVRAAEPLRDELNTGERRGDRVVVNLEGQP
jgi:hypothetical protein